MDVEPGSKENLAPAPASWPGFVLACLIAFVPPFLVSREDPAMLVTVALGGGSWAIAVILKLLTARVVGKVLQTNARIWVSSIWGLYSGITELGAAALCFITIMDEINLLEIIAFGAGASSLEIIYVIVTGIITEIRHPDPNAQEKWIAAARKSWVVRYMLAIERSSALLSHVGTRGMVYLTITTGIIWPVVLGLASFTAVDGAAIYGRAKKWDWLSPRIARRFYFFITIISVLDITVFGLFWASLVGSAW